MTRFWQNELKAPHLKHLPNYLRSAGLSQSTGPSKTPTSLFLLSMSWFFMWDAFLSCLYYYGSRVDMSDSRFLLWLICSDIRNWHCKERMNEAYIALETYHARAYQKCGNPESFSHMYWGLLIVREDEADGCIAEFPSVRTTSTHFFLPFP